MYENSEPPSRQSYGPGNSSRWRIIDITPLPQPTEVTGTLVPLPPLEPIQELPPRITPGTVRAKRLWDELDVMLSRPPTPTAPVKAVRASDRGAAPQPEAERKRRSRPGWQVALIIAAIVLCVLVAGAVAVGAFAVFAPADLPAWLLPVREWLLGTGLFG